MDTIRWGVLGTGGMAVAFAEALGEIPEAEVAAVGSRSKEAAEAFAARFGLEAAYGSHEAVAKDTAVDVIYVATTNDLHHRNVLDSLAAGKAVLCEKAFAVNLSQAEEMVEVARARRLFLMEAMWMRFQPAMYRLEELIAQDAIGEALHIHADFGFPADPNPSRRWLAPDLGGGSLLDLGVYPLTLVIGLLGDPDEIEAIADFASTGVDRQLAAVGRHRQGAISVWSCSVAADTVIEAVVSGPKGSLRVHSPFHHSSLLTHERRGRLIETYDVSYSGSGYRFEIAEVHRCLREGLTESRRMPLELTLRVMRALEQVRARVGLRFPST